MFSTIRHTVQLFNSFQGTQMLALGDEGEEFDLQDYADKYTAARDTYIEAAEALKLATGPYKASRDAYVAASASTAPRRVPAVFPAAPAHACADSTGWTPLTSANVCSRHVHQDHVRLKGRRCLEACKSCRCFSAVWRAAAMPPEFGLSQARRHGHSLLQTLSTA